LTVLFAIGVFIALWFALVMQPTIMGCAVLPLRADYLMHAATF